MYHKENRKYSGTGGLLLLMAVFLMLCSACGSETTEAAPSDSDSAVMKSYTITRIQGTVDWDDIPTLDLDSILWEPDQGVRASGQLCYDDENLYVHLMAVETDIRAENTEPLSPVCQDSCLEFFFQPEGETRYFNFEINPNGCLYIGFGHGRADSTALYRGDMQEFFDIQADRTNDGWEVYYRIPVVFLQVFYPDYTFSGSLRANVYKCGDLTDHKHYLSWNPVKSEKPDYHRPEDFGRMPFEE